MDITQRKLLMTGQFVWVVNTQDGKYGIFVGPSPLTDVKDEDIPLKPKNLSSGELTPVDKVMNAVQKCVTIKEDQYAILHNPSESFGVLTPNGRWEPNSRNPLPTMLYGKKRVITEGNFPLWPEQWIEIKTVHHLYSNQYLMVEVESGDVDQSAPYYALTAQCAKIKKAVVDESVDSKDEEEVQTVSDVVSDKDAPETDGQDEDISSEVKIETKDDIKIEDQQPPEGEDSSEIVAEPKAPFHVGQRIIIPGSMTERYIPPTGIKVVSIEVDSNNSDNGVEPDCLLSGGDTMEDLLSKGDITPQNIEEIMQQAGLKGDFSDVYSYYHDYKGSYSEKGALLKAFNRVLTSDEIRKIINVVEASRYRQPASVEPVSDDNAIRKAIVLGPTEFCVLIDEEGNPRTKEGPGRVFPGPYDTIRTKGSRNGAYDSYHIRPDRGILLRIVSNGVRANELMQLLPKEVDMSEFGENKVFQKGDEIFIGGVDAYVVPHSMFEVIEPETRNPHIGNEHANVYVKAIGVDQKSGVYVRNIETGNVKLEEGEAKLLLDPRRYVHEKRRVPSKMWDLLISHGESHKKSSGRDIITTPWALSVIIPNNEAILITSKDGRRVAMGPKTELLAYEEVGEILTLSRGRRKSDDHLLETCFLRVKGNRVTDQIDLITSDKIIITVDVQYGVRFVAEKEEEAEKWFNFPNYINLLVTSTRSRLRAAAQLSSLMDLDKDMAGFIRDTILGEKGKEEGPRSGLLFAENNMMVEEVDVLSYDIKDSSVANSLAESNHVIINRLIEDSTKKAVLESDQLRADIDASEKKLEVERLNREEAHASKESENAKAIAKQSADKDKHIAGIIDGVEKVKARLVHGRVMEEISRSGDKMLARQTIEDEEAILRRKREEEDHRLALERKKQKREDEVTFRNALVEIQKAIIDAEGKWDVDRLKSIQPHLIKAIEGLGDKQALTALAENLPEAGGQLGFLTEAGGIAALKFLTKGTKFGKAIDALNDDAKSISEDDE